MKGIAVYTLIVSFLLSSCTSQMWETPEYKESISSFLIDENKENIVVLGKTYHYIFKLYPALREVISNGGHLPTKASFYKFHVDNDQNITGRLTLNVDGNISRGAVDKLKRLGFSKSEHRNEYFLIKKMHGIRYQANPDIRISGKFNYNYEIEVTEDFSSLGKVTRIAASPVTVAADGALAISGLALTVVVALTLPTIWQLQGKKGK